MENWIQRIFLALVKPAVIGSALLLWAGIGLAEEAERSIFDPKVERREIDTSLIDSENWELGLYFGVISIEDFSSSHIKGALLNYHISEDFFLGLDYGEARAGETSFERLTGDALLLTEEQRDYAFYRFSLGFKLLPGEGFLSNRYAFSSNFYLQAGLGSTEFAGDDRSTVTLGGGYQVLFNDWLSLHFMAKKHSYDIDLLGSEKTVNDLEFSTALTAFF